MPEWSNPCLIMNEKLLETQSHQSYYSYAEEA